MLSELLNDTERLLREEYGNYVIQHILEHGSQEAKSQIVSIVKGRVGQLSRHKHASNVVEKCVINATEGERESLIREVIEDQQSLGEMACDQFANYVIQKMMELASEDVQKKLTNGLR